MMEDLLERWEKMGGDREGFASEEEILMEADAENWDQSVALLRKLKRPMDQGAAELLLEQGLQAAPMEVFAQLLDILPMRDTIGSVMVEPREAKCSVKATGTLVLLAAMQGKREKLRCLLERGWDVNGASMDAAYGLKRYIRHANSIYQRLQDQSEPCNARPESRLMLVDPLENLWQSQILRSIICGATPLAAAILCGETDCVRLLLGYGAWKEASPSVSRVLFRPGWEAAGYEVCRRLVFDFGAAPRPAALWAVVRSMPPEELDRELCRATYPEETVARVVWEVAEGFRPGIHRGCWHEERRRDLERLQILERHFPQVLRKQELVSVLLRWCMLQNGEEDAQEFVLSLCQERVDLSLIREGLSRMQPRKADAFLRRICQGRICVMDRDSVPPFTSYLILQTLIENVEFLPPVSGGSVSGLSYAILNTGNLRLIRNALETGAIPAEESTELLLRCPALQDGAAAVRAMLMMRGHNEGADAAGEHWKPLLHSRMFRWFPPEQEKVGWQQLLQNEDSETQERELVMRGQYRCGDNMRLELADEIWETDSLLSLLCWKGRHRAVERWVRLGPKEALRYVYTLHPEGGGYTLKATPLCMAAFSGQKKTVETLLSLGAAAEEQAMGMPSTILSKKLRGELPITPLLAAMVQGHWDIARLLCARGASCDANQQTVKRLWKLFQKEELRAALQRNLPGLRT